MDGSKCSVVQAQIPSAPNTNFTISLYFLICHGLHTFNRVVIYDYYNKLKPVEQGPCAHIVPLRLVQLSFLLLYTIKRRSEY